MEQNLFSLEHHLWTSLGLQSWYCGLPTHTAWISAYALHHARAWLILARFGSFLICAKLRLKMFSKGSDLALIDISGLDRLCQTLFYIMVQVLDCCRTWCAILIYCALIHMGARFFSYGLKVFQSIALKSQGKKGSNKIIGDLQMQLAMSILCPDHLEIYYNMRATVK